MKNYRQLFKTKQIKPIIGDVVALSNVIDPVFSRVGLWAKGIAVKASQGVVYAPADAEVSIAFQQDAFGLKTTNGAEVLIHVGIDTVTMNGEGFEQKVAQGDKVKAGDVLGTFELKQNRCSWS